jgi:hypothetical protein
MACAGAAALHRAERSRQFVALGVSKYVRRHFEAAVLKAFRAAALTCT